MKSFRKIIIITFFIYWGGYIGAMYLFSLFGHITFDKSVVWTGLASAVFFEVIYWGLLWFTFKPKLRYIEAATNAKPEFRDTQTLEVAVPDAGFSVTRLREILPPHVHVTYMDEEAGVMKFRTPYNRKAWGILTHVAWQQESGTVVLSSFPMSGYTKTATRKAKEQNEALAQLVQVLDEPEDA
ncbi:hypothetical protein [Prolixibacter denitrificans]|uniref:Uncharacterized protein n=1 Tax=Prolixibacter denitrificans TaxID=1541063 RepID=A0A2P8CAT0_9BACT|nr:hypothetical protein [Prolixibacter denitrificans]PSK82032.1 hypothetical protein CLV93_107146 [Prolixibacter denitrificans]GET22624.1 hypothetical protein JCM18694_28700 [Prolixibacter denitrificans]